MGGRFFQLVALGVAEEWIFGARATLAMFEEDYEKALANFVKAKDIPRAYLILCSWELPRLVLDGHFDKALDYLKIMNEHEDKIDDFEFRGAVYQRYLDIIHDEEEPNLEEYTSLQEDLKKIQPTTHWEDALITKMLQWIEEIESNAAHAETQDEDFLEDDKEDWNYVHEYGKEKQGPHLLEAMIEEGVIETYEIPADINVDDR